jgi:hypothetical protein
MPRYADTILCELIRMESNNKLSLFGLFGHGIFVQQVPVVLPGFAFLQRWEPTADELPGTLFSFSIRLRGPNLDLEIYPPTNVPVPSPPRPLMQIAVQVQGIPFAQEGDYDLLTSVNNEVRHRETFFIVIPTPQQLRDFALTGFAPT